MEISKEALKMKMVAPKLAASSIDTRNKALEYIIEGLLRNKDRIFEENRKDMENAVKDNVAASIQKRLKYDEHKLSDSVEGLKQLITLSDPVGKVLLNRELDKDLVLTRVTVPIGVIGVIFEARPDAMVQVASLCIKSGNCAILKGGKETVNTNKILFDIIKESVIKANLPGECLMQVTLHNEIDELLACDREVDLLIPRGSNKFVRYIMENTKIPVMGHSSGICHIYVDEKADFENSINIIIDAKTQYVAACNAVETVLINKKVADSFLLALYKALQNNNVEVRATKEVFEKLAALSNGEIPVPSETDKVKDYEKIMQEEDFATEYNDMIISLKLVDDVEKAVEHINTYGSHHTDAIMTGDDKVAEYFEQMVDSAGVYRNCSTRFADGFRYGFGAEVGISTGKLHARGPVGLEGLVTYKYKLIGNNNIVGDYATGKKSFHFKELL
ncbi:glutamate-5-semialdehyde dehydrogenase [Butyrivibrio sp. NC3005]|uniref:glutamate-5-semialdehyde dehydrogenase n=1 Tax=Butyrivibrio sp. NC3005 TaxID=1280685 RepID=UPI000422A67B|nr:glutamate-5-semialdehyde dehydrogenase [Butyrivibrio sp. NC3005]